MKTEPIDLWRQSKGLTHECTNCGDWIEPDTADGETGDCQRCRDEHSLRIRAILAEAEVKRLQTLLALFQRRYEWDGHLRPDGCRPYDSAVLMETQRKIDALQPNPDAGLRP